MIEPIRVSDLKTLRKVVLAAIREHGPSVGLNFIDVGGVDKFDGLFKDTGFCGDVSGWDMAKAQSTKKMFAGTPFNGDLSKWNLEELTDARGMFKDSSFNGDVSQWNIVTMLRCEKNEGLFDNSCFSQDLTAWDVGNVREQLELFMLSALTRHTQLWSAIAGNDKPTPVTPQANVLREASLKAYARLFGGQERFGEYLARAPFGVMHFDACCMSEQCPVGVSQKDFEWSRELLTVGTGLGLDNAGLRALCVSQLKSRYQDMAESFSLDGLVR